MHIILCSIFTRKKEKRAKAITKDIFHDLNTACLKCKYEFNDIFFKVSTHKKPLIIFQMVLTVIFQAPNILNTNPYKMYIEVVNYKYMNSYSTYLII